MRVVYNSLRCFFCTFLRQSEDEDKETKNMKHSFLSVSSKYNSLSGDIVWVCITEQSVNLINLSDGDTICLFVFFSFSVI